MARTRMPRSTELIQQLRDALAAASDAAQA